ncbi:cytochrome P450 [uncultured Aquimarina sp.]|uniref:cytochrome P450 n=1 Tax=uncultured Aquimarina sp. TaxID=575652 RepID=UPI00261EDA23|nr:cytochrome P450 [uncultured Aquimarina sp.]
MKNSKFSDPFDKARQEKGYGEMNDQDDPVTMVLRLKDVRKCAHNWKTYQSGAAPGRIVIPSEVQIRDTRQIPFEVDPPMHKTYRDLIEDWFKRPLLPEYQADLVNIIEDIVDEAATKNGAVEIVEEFALRIQSRALTLLLNIPYEESETWISWGTHVFRSEDNTLDGSKANILYDYIDAQIENAVKNPGKDLYSVLLNTNIEDRKLTREEVKGIMILTFAGGRDTVINSITNTIAYFAEHKESLQLLKDNPEIISKAVEELIRYFAPLTQMGRVTTQDTAVCKHAIKKDTRISLCWASANRDETVFENPNEVMLDRKINPHVSFGFSHHKCLGATHARQIMKKLLQVLTKKVASIDIIDAQENIEELGEFKRKVGFDSLRVKFNK